MACDFNLVQEPALDFFNYNNVNNPAARKSLLSLKESHCLVDPWRIKFDKRKIYTWSKSNPPKKPDLFFFLVSSIKIEKKTKRKRLWDLPVIVRLRPLIRSQEGCQKPFF